jgi:addiction module RelE/StbE family toxin
MIVNKIYYSKKFIKELKKLPKDISSLVARKEEILKENPLHPSLRLHELHGNLKGFWSISLNDNYRIIFIKRPNKNILFIFVGNHDIYKNINFFKQNF